MTSNETSTVVSRFPVATDSRPLHDTVNLMTEQNRQLSTKIVELEAAVSFHRGKSEAKDWAWKILAEELLDEAMTRGWCDEYNEFVDKVNGRIRDNASNSGFMLNGQETDYEVTASCSVTVVRTVRATSKKAAEDEAMGWGASDLEDSFSEFTIENFDVDSIDECKVED